MTLAQRLSSFERLTGVTSQKRTSLDEKVQQLVASPTLMLWRAIEEMSVDRLTAAMGTLQIQGALLLYHRWLCIFNSQV